MQELKQRLTGWEAGIGAPTDSTVLYIELPVRSAQSDGIVKDIKRR